MDPVLSGIDVTPIDCFRDNYAFRIRCKSTGAVALVDPADPEAALAVIDDRLDAILCTHHHPDHVGGNEALLKRFPDARVYGHASDRGRIPGLSHGVDQGDVIEIGAAKARILHVPGHTTGAIAYHFRDDVFTGDTLFIAGCGRLFEGNPAQMFDSMAKLRALSPQTRVWVAHEYTESNLRFAAAVEPDNAAIATAQKRVEAMRVRGERTIPSTIELELKINPFLRAESAQVLAERRAAKDAF